MQIVFIVWLHMTVHVGLLTLDTASICCIHCMFFFLQGVL